MVLEKMTTEYNDPPKCPRCSNQMKKASVEIWGDETASTGAWTCHVKSCPVYTFVMKEGQTNTFENWLRKVK